MPDQMESDCLADLEDIVDAGQKNDRDCLTELDDIVDYSEGPEKDIVQHFRMRAQAR